MASVDSAIAIRRLGGQNNMLSAVSAYYDGEQIVLDEPVDLLRGQRLIVTILENAVAPTKKVDLSRYVGRGPKMFGEGQADEYVRELRANDRV